MRGRLVLLALEQVDAVLDEVGVEVLDLLLGEIDLLQPGNDFIEGQKTLLLALLYELVKLLDVRERDIDRQHGTSPFLVTDAIDLPRASNERAGEIGAPGSKVGRHCTQDRDNRRRSGGGSRAPWPSGASASFPVDLDPSGEADDARPVDSEPGKAREG